MADADNVVAAIDELTKQVARLAYAVEARGGSMVGAITCRACLSTIQTKGRARCLACGEDMSDG